MRLVQALDLFLAITSKPDLDFVFRILRKSVVNQNPAAGPERQSRHVLLLRQDVRQRPHPGISRVAPALPCMWLHWVVSCRRAAFGGRAAAGRLSPKSPDEPQVGRK